MPAIIGALIGALLSAVVLPIAYAFSVYAPMILGNAFYQIYLYTGGKAVCDMIFGTTIDGLDPGKWNVQINLNNPFARILLGMTIAGIITFAIFCGLRALAHFSRFGKRHSVGVGRLAYGICGIAIVPLAFSLLTLLVNFIFVFLTPGLSNTLLTVSQVQSIQTWVRTCINDNIISPLNSNPFTGGKNLHDSITDLIQVVQSISQKMQTAGSDDGYQAAQDVLRDLTSIQTMTSSDWWNDSSTGLLGMFDSAFNAYIASGGNTHLNDWSLFSTPYDNLCNFQTSWDKLWSDINTLNGYQNVVSDQPDFNAIKTWQETITNGNIGRAFLGWTSGKIFIDSYVTQLFIGQENTSTGAVTNTMISLNTFQTCANPSSDFNLFTQIFQYTTGSSSNNWRNFWIYYGAGYEVWRFPSMIMGAAAAAIVCGALYAYGTFVLKRLADLIFFWCWSIWFAFADNSEGTRFRKTMRLIRLKMFSIVFIQASFFMVNILCNLNIFSGIKDEWAPGIILIANSILFSISYGIGDQLCGLFFHEQNQLFGAYAQIQSIKGGGEHWNQHASGVGSTMQSMGQGTGQSTSSITNSITQHRRNRSK